MGGQPVDPNLFSNISTFDLFPVIIVAGPIVLPSDSWVGAKDVITYLE